MDEKFKLPIELLTKIAINQIISGFLYESGEIERVPIILKDMAADYEAEIAKHLKH